MKPFFTIPDNDLTSESSVDPMGILVIWTEFGQAIFKNKITTIANDMRVFHFNLFHSYILYRLEHDYQSEVEKAINRYAGLRHDNFKAGMYIFLEDLVNFVFTYSNRKGISQEGILGINKAKARMVDGANKITLAVNKNSGLLVKQATYGMMGRYKGPFYALNYFHSRNYQFNDDRWKEALDLMNDWKQGKQLADVLIRFIRTVVLQSKRSEYPSVNLEQLMDSHWWSKIHDGYLDCFGAKKLGGISVDYWRKQLGFRDGAAAAIYSAVKQESTRGNYHVRGAFEKAHNLCKEAEEKNKIRNILLVEDFLSHCEYIFRFICNGSVKNLDDCREEIEIIRKKMLATGIEKFVTTNKRLKQLRKVALAKGSTEQWLQGIIEYHKKIMNDRGSTPWIEMIDGNKFRHYFNVGLRQEIAKVKDYVKSNYWMHDYYYGAILSLQRSMN